MTIFQFYGLVERCKYYGVWTLTEVGLLVIACNVTN